MAGRAADGGPVVHSALSLLPRWTVPLARFLRSDAAARLVRWWAVGIIALGADLGAIYVAHESIGLPLPIAALLAGEAVQLVRFLAVDRWVFGHSRPTRTRLWQYHVACFTAMVLHWLVLNGLAFLGLHYLLATVAATAVTVSWSMLTNFLWIWRHKAQPSTQPTQPSAAGVRARESVG